jgi:uncharacterized membrane protein (UPF0127 family)
VLLRLREIAELYHGGMTARRSAAAVLAILALTWPGCSSSSSSPSRANGAPSATAAATVTPVSFERSRVSYSRDGAPAEIAVEVASTPAQSERGLGYRDSLPADAGMLFDLHATTTPQFWMKGMRFSLDLVWIGEDKRVMSITAIVPFQPPGTPDSQLPRYTSPLPVRYVLELNAGAANRLGLAQGTQLAFELPPAQEQ